MARVPLRLFEEKKILETKQLFSSSLRNPIMFYFQTGSLSTRQNEQEKAQTPSTAKRTSKRTLQKRRERAGESPKPRTRKEENEQKKAQDPPRRSGRSWRRRTACGQMNGAGAT